jgi:cell division protein FtsN
VVEFQLGNKQLFLLFIGLLIICAIFFFIGLRVGEDTAKGKVSLSLAENMSGEAAVSNSKEAAGEQSINIRPAASNNSPGRKNKAATNKQLTGGDAGKSNSVVAKIDKTTAKQTSQPTKPESKANTVAAKTELSGSGVIGSKYYVQIAAQINATSAERVRSKVPKSLNTLVEKALVNNKYYYRVLVGPYDTKQMAQETRTALLSTFREAFVRFVK